MAIDARIRELGTRHQSLDRAIDEEIRRPAHDPVKLTALKRKKLRVKEEIESLQGANAH